MPRSSPPVSHQSLGRLDPGNRWYSNLDLLGNFVDNHDELLSIAVVMADSPGGALVIVVVVGLFLEHIMAPSKAQLGFFDGQFRE